MVKNEMCMGHVKRFSLQHKSGIADPAIPLLMHTERIPAFFWVPFLSRKKRYVRKYSQNHASRFPSPSLSR